MKAAALQEPGLLERGGLFYIRIIEQRDFKCPSVSTVQKYVNPKASLRGGRKGFVSLMWEIGKYPKHTSYRWLGHKSMRTTDNHYVQGIQQACEFQTGGRVQQIGSVRRKVG